MQDGESLTSDACILQHDSFLFNILPYTQLVENSCHIDRKLNTSSDKPKIGSTLKYLDVGEPFLRQRQSTAQTAHAYERINVSLPVLKNGVPQAVQVGIKDMQVKGHTCANDAYPQILDLFWDSHIEYLLCWGIVKRIGAPGEI